MAVADYQGAMKDASMVLVTLRNPTNPGALLVQVLVLVLVTLHNLLNPALLVQGDALYHTGLFEHSLVSYYKVRHQKRWKGGIRSSDVSTFPMLIARQADSLTS